MVPRQAHAYKRRRARGEDFLGIGLVLALAVIMAVLVAFSFANGTGDASSGSIDVAVTVGDGDSATTLEPSDDVYYSNEAVTVTLTYTGTLATTADESSAGSAGMGSSLAGSSEGSGSSAAVVDASKSYVTVTSDSSTDTDTLEWTYCESAQAYVASTPLSADGTYTIEALATPAGDDATAVKSTSTVVIYSKKPTVSAAYTSTSDVYGSRSVAVTVSGQYLSTEKLTVTTVGGDDYEATCDEEWTNSSEEGSETTSYTCTVTFAPTKDEGTVKVSGKLFTVSGSDTLGNTVVAGTVGDDLSSSSDDEGIVFSTDEDGFTLDAQCPGIKVTSPSANSDDLYYFNSAPSFTLEASDNSGVDFGTFEVQVQDSSNVVIDGAATAADAVAGGDGSYSWTVSVSEEKLTSGGTYTLVASVEDTGGTQGEYSWTFVYDTDKPTIVYDDADNEDIYSETGSDDSVTYYYGSDDLSNGTLSVGVTVTESFLADDHPTVSISSTDGTATASSWEKQDGGVHKASVSITQSGTYTLTVSATDKAGNESTASYTVVLDTGNPTATICSPYTANTYNDVSYYGPAVESYAENNKNKAEFTISLSDDENNLVFSEDDGTITLSANTVTLTTDGGEPADVTGKITWSKATDEDSGVVTVSGTYSVSAEGTYTLAVTTTDKAGNTSDKASVSFVIDTTDPEASVALSAGGNDVDGCTYYRDEGGISVDASDGVGLASISVKDAYGNDYSGKLSPALTSGATSYEKGKVTISEEGTYTLTVTVTDMAGNETTAASDTFVVDTTGPEVDVALSAGGNEVDGCTYYSGEGGISVTASDEADGLLSIRVEGEDGADYSGFLDSELSNGDASYEGAVTISEEGTYKLTVTVTDMAGNPTAVTFDDFGTFVVDNTNPTLSVEWEDAPSGNDGTYFTSRTLTLTLTEANFANLDSTDDVGDYITVAVTLDSAEVEAQGSWKQDADDPSVYTYELTFAKDSADYTTDGEYAISVEGEDQAGNVLVAADDGTVVDGEGKYTSDTFVLDNTAPTLSVTWKDTRLDEAKEGYYTKRVATLTLVEKNFAITEDDDDLNGGDYITVTAEGATVGRWDATGNDREYECTVTFSEDADCTLEVSGHDQAGNLLAAADGSDITVEDGAWAVSFIIDTTPPVIELTLNRKWANQYSISGKKVDYFANKVELSITATDTNIAWGKYTATGENVSSKADDLKGSDSLSGSVTYGENTSRKLSTANGIEVVVQDKAGNKTTYTYGASEATVVTSGGTKSADCGCSTKANGTEVNGTAFFCDVTAPYIQVKNLVNKSYSNKYKGLYVFYNKSKAKLTLVVKDSLGIANVELDENDNYSYTMAASKYGNTTVKATVTLKEGKTWSRNMIFTLTDLVGNQRTWSISKYGTVTEISKASKAKNTALYKAQKSLYPTSLILDATNPTVKLSGVESGANVTSATVRATVQEDNFKYLKRYDKTQTVLSIYRTANKSGASESLYKTVSVSSFTGSDGTYTASKTFENDGHYRVVAQVTDPATNTSKKKTVSFTVDTTAPTCEVSWDNESAENGSYYSAERTATITIEEHNFDESLIDIETTGTVGSWSSSGDTHTCTVSFGEGDHTLSISGEDEAGNAMTAYTADEFTVDMTAPSITFENVKNKTAYNGEVAPAIVFKDEANFDSSGVSYKLVGTKNGNVTGEEGYEVSVSKNSSGETVAYVDFDQDDASMDDIYTLSAEMTDLAGNSYEDSITFSVNRFGSTYRVVNADNYSTDTEKKALSEAPTVIVEEVNVSGVVSESPFVRVEKNGETSFSELVKTSSANTGATYTIVEEESEEGWSLYTYTIASGNFDEDGRYTVNIGSDDTAGNDNALEYYYDRDEEAYASEQTVSFVLDSTAPEIRLDTSLSEGDCKEGSNYEVEFTVVEEIGVDEDTVAVKVGDESVDVTSNGDQSYTFTIEAKAFSPRTITITASDLAGNEGSLEVAKVRVTTNFIECHPVLFALLCVVALAIIGAAIYLVLRRRKKSGATGADATA